jgi:hypothetical protein
LNRPLRGRLFRNSSFPRSTEADAKVVQHQVDIDTSRLGH